jgi:hypothetical protein
MRRASRRYSVCVTRSSYRNRDASRLRSTINGEHAPEGLREPKRTAIVPDEQGAPNNALAKNSSFP